MAIFSRFGARDSSANDAFIAPQIKLHFDYIEGKLRKSTWFVGEEFTAADIRQELSSGIGCCASRTHGEPTKGSLISGSISAKV